MKKPTRTDRKQSSALSQKPKWGSRKTVFIVLAVAILAVTGFWILKSSRTDSQSLTPQSAQTGPDFQKLKGKWRRSDADYVLDITSVDNTGKLTASYFNPKKINVSRAEASRQGADLHVTIELRDELYPGSTYRLTYDVASNTLSGTYYHAGLKQNFEVAFVKAN